jgi:methyltransferase-like protein
MTNNSVFKDFKEIIESYQDSLNNSGNFPEVNKNTFRCLQCQRQISYSQYSPYCSSQCMNEYDKGIDHKGSEKNTMSLLGFSAGFGG